MLFALLAQAALADLPAGAPVMEAVAVQLSEQGLANLAELLPALVPADPMALDPIGSSAGGFCFEYAYELSGAELTLDVLGASLTPGVGRLTLEADLLVALNSPERPFSLTLEAICLIDEDCSGSIDPFGARVTLPIDLTVTGPAGARVLRASVPSVHLQHQLTLNELRTDCALNDIEQVLNNFGVSLFDLVLGLFKDTLVTELEAALNDALVAASYEDVLEVSGAAVEVAVQPQAVTVTPAGLELVLAGRLDAAPHDCIAAFDPGSSASTGGPKPSVSGNPPGAEIATHLSGDLVNQALYAFWRGGLLCQRLDDDAADLPIALDTTLLGLLGGEPYNALLPDPAPLEIVTLPHAAPTVALEGPHDLDVELREFELAFLAELDGRMARVLGVSLDADLGADLLFDDTTGALTVALDLGEDALTARLAGDVMVPGAEEEVLDNFGRVLGGLLGTLLDGLLGDSLAFALPTFGGVGLAEAQVGTSGPDGDWIGVYAGLDAVAYGDPYAEGCGCGEDGGDESCGGCSSTGGSAAGWALAAALVALRRRRAPRDQTR